MEPGLIGGEVNRILAAHAKKGNHPIQVSAPCPPAFAALHDGVALLLQRLTQLAGHQHHRRCVGYRGCRRHWPYGAWLAPPAETATLRSVQFCCGCRPSSPYYWRPIIADSVSPEPQYKIGPDPSSIDSCMVGGMVSNNSSGMCCGVAQNTYHTLKDMRVVLADGSLLDTADPASRAAFLEVLVPPPIRILNPFLGVTTISQGCLRFFACLCVASELHTSGASHTWTLRVHPGSQCCSCRC